MHTYRIFTFDPITGLHYVFCRIMDVDGTFLWTFLPPHEIEKALTGDDGGVLETYDFGSLYDAVEALNAFEAKYGQRGKPRILCGLKVDFDWIPIGDALHSD